MDWPSDRWREWAERSGRVIQQAQILREKHAIWKLYSERWNAHPPPDAEVPFHDWLAYNFIDSIMIGIRRMTDQDGDAESLDRLLFEIERNAGEVTFRQYRRLWGQRSGRAHDAGDLADDTIARSQFAPFARAGTKLLSEVPAEDRRLLQVGLRSFREWADMNVAHRAHPEKPRPSIAFADIDGALDLVERIAVKYHALLTLGGYVRLEPVPAWDPQHVMDRLFGPRQGR